MTIHDIETRLQTLQPGERFVYARSGRKKAPSRSALGIARGLYKRGSLCLVQRKIAPFTYDYIAVGAK